MHTEVQARFSPLSALRDVETALVQSFPPRERADMMAAATVLMLRTNNATRRTARVTFDELSATIGRSRPVLVAAIGRMRRAGIIAADRNPMGTVYRWLDWKPAQKGVSASQNRRPEEPATDAAEAADEAELELDAAEVETAAPVSKPAKPGNPWEVIRARCPVDGEIVNAYYAARWNRYQMGLGLLAPEPETWAELRHVVERAMAHHGTPRAAAAAVFARWFARDGQRSFLREVHHDLRRIGPDLSDLAAAFERPPAAAKTEPRRPAAPTAAPVSPREAAALASSALAMFSAPPALSAAEGGAK